MARGFAARFREEIDAREVGGAALVVGVLYLLGLEVAAVGVLAGLFVLAPAFRAAVEAAGVDIGTALARFLLGAFVAVAGLSVSTGESVWLGGALIVFGWWLCLDAVYGWRTDAFDDADDSANEEAMTDEELLLYGEYNRRIVEELRGADRPLTAAELTSRTGLSDEEFDRVLELHWDSTPIERVGNGYAVDEDRLGVWSLLRTSVRTVGRRFLRPFRLFRPAG